MSKKAEPSNFSWVRFKFVLMIWDFLCVAASMVLALLTDGTDVFLETLRTHTYYVCFALNCAVCIGVFGLTHLYQDSTEHIGAFEGLKILCAGVGVTAMHALEVFLLFPELRDIIKPAYLPLFFFLLIASTASIRYRKRVMRAIRTHLLNRHNNSNNIVRVMIVGAGEAGTVLLREIENSDKLNLAAVCMIDDDPMKLGNHIFGVPVAGNRNRIPELAKKYDVQEIYIAIPSLQGEELGRLVAKAHETGCRVKLLPGIYQLINGEVSLHALREVKIEDLLSRDMIHLNTDAASEFLEDKVIMVTGGGGSIGSELCRQIAAHHPHQLIIVDIYENNAYDIQQELVKKYPRLNLVTLIASVRDKTRMERIFRTYSPQIVFHAAAHKHVPLMEESPNEAIKNNVFGTLNTATLAAQYGVEKFVLISTDKAVNPTNVMGASKRICEMIVQGLSGKSRTEFAAVRFGNVLGSNGSVVPLFRKQIAEGGPVTITHPDIIRYFMTIPEAVALVIQAGAYAKGGEIFVLDMGKPVKILDLAENLIRLSGMEPYKDIEIKFTGLRPGEKLYEEMLMAEEGLQETENKLIHIGKPIEMDETKFFDKLEELHHALESEPTNARALIRQLVPTYKGNTSLKNV